MSASSPTEKPKARLLLCGPRGFCAGVDRAIQMVVLALKKHGAPELLVLDHVNFAIHSGEIIAILGKSGSGKSTLLRIIAGLVRPTSGEVLYQSKPVVKPQPGLTMVFQHFALMPWLTVLQNVELGLEAKGVSRGERRNRAIDAILSICGSNVCFSRKFRLASKSTLTSSIRNT